jgi:hypothetical protein
MASVEERVTEGEARGIADDQTALGEILNTEDCEPGDDGRKGEVGLDIGENSWQFMGLVEIKKSKTSLKDSKSNRSQLHQGVT